MDKLSYALGMSIAQSLIQSGVNELAYEDFKNAVADCLEGREPAIPMDEANDVLNDFFARTQQEMMEKQKEVAAAFKADGENWLAENAKKEGVNVLPSGLQYKVVKEGNGKKPGKSAQVKCHYEGFLIDGTVFDSSVQRGEPAVFGLQQVIAGWTEGLQLMQEGAKYRFFIPYMLAYGEGGAGQSIPPYAALIFDVELIAVV